MVLVVVVGLVVGGAAWALWPATTWPRAFCAPVERVVGADAVAISKSFSHPEPTLTNAQQDQVARLMYDVTLASGTAPTAQLQSELNRYLAELGVVLSTNIVTDAMSNFDQQAGTQLRACGIAPVGR